ncbi:hypothetical protein TKK_0002011 [Trichogramma kaykai]|uniref:Peptidase S1 domain-containing protein n=1 Tax=Trichogramma kaykai TaxID=54128 RepID=A0ABD2X8E7_9HYME
MATLAKLVLFAFCITLASSQEDNQHEKLRLTQNKLRSGIGTEFPMQVSVQANGQHKCAGTLITIRHVLTSAYCVYSQFSSPTPILEVRTALMHAQYAQLIKIKRVVRHSAYQYTQGRTLGRNDIAIITLADKVKMSAHVKIAALPLDYFEEYPMGKTVHHSGFNLLGMPMPVSSSLDHIYNCGTKMQSVMHPAHICTNENLIRNYPGGDSGSGLFDENKLTVIGVMSGEPALERTGTPMIYTKVSYYLDFIYPEIDLFSNNKYVRSRHPAVDFQ